MSEKKMTMADIAKKAGVGKSTVSRYFNGGYVKEETKQKIKEIIEKYDYEPNALAQMLKAKKTNIVGVITPTLDSVTSSRLMMTMDEYLRTYGYTTLIVNTNHNEIRELKSIENLWHQKVDAIVLLGSSITMAHHDLINKLDIPVVVTGQKFDEGNDVVYDDYNAGYDIGKYIVDHGHKHIVFVGVNRKDESVGVIRKKGVYDALKDGNVEKTHYVESNFSFDKTYHKMKEYLDTHSKPDAIICSTDNQALGTYKAIVEKGYKVPDDISLTGFGGYETSMLITPSLVTVRYENEEAGCVAGRMAIDLIEGNETERHKVIGYVLMEGESVKQKA